MEWVGCNLPQAHHSSAAACILGTEQIKALSKPYEAYTLYGSCIDHTVSTKSTRQALLRFHLYLNRYLSYRLFCLQAMRCFSRLAQRPAIQLCAFCLLGLLGACTHSPINAPRSSDMPPAIKLNGIMVGSANRLTLYTYEGDGPLQSNCLESCIKHWLPFYANEHDVSRGDFSVFTRQDGRKQWALMNKPLYFWAGEWLPSEEHMEEKNHDPRWKVFRVQPSLTQ